MRGIRPLSFFVVWMRISPRTGASLLLVTLTASPVVGQGADAPGRIRGHVRLEAGTFVNPPIRMGVDPACGMAAGAVRRQEFVLRAADGGLANVFVRLVGDYPRGAVPAMPVVLEQRGCVYAPHVLGIMAGQRLRVVNADPTAHNVHSLSAVGNGFNFSQPRAGEAVEVTLPDEELMLRVTCDVHAWMNIFVGVVAHPYFTVSSQDGGFELAGVPAGTHRLDIWHERFGPLTAEVVVRPGETATADFHYRGDERPAAPAQVFDFRAGNVEAQQGTVIGSGFQP